MQCSEEKFCLSNSWGRLQRMFYCNTEMLILQVTTILGFTRERVNDSKNVNEAVVPVKSLLHGKLS